MNAKQLHMERPLPVRKDEQQREDFRALTDTLRDINETLERIYDAIMSATDRPR